MRAWPNLRGKNERGERDGVKSGRTCILSISNDESILGTRYLVLQQLGYNVVSALGFAEALDQCKHSAEFNVCILGSSIEEPERRALVPVFRANSAGRVIVLKKHPEENVPEADFAIEPAQLLPTLATVAADRAA